MVMFSRYWWNVSLTDMIVFILYKAITSFEEAKQSDIENERLPPTTRLSKVAAQQQATNTKIKNAVEQKDQSVERIAEAIASPNDDDQQKRAPKVPPM